MSRVLLGIGVLLFLGTQQASVPAQDPAFLGGYQAVRFDEGSDVFHYVYSCIPGRELARLPEIAATLNAAVEPAVCWPVAALRMKKNGANYDTSPVVQGVIISSAQHFRFAPSEAKNTALYTDYSSSEVDVQHKPGEAFGFFGTKEVFFKFGFANICSSCQNGAAPPPPRDTAQLDREFELLRNSIRQFDAVSRQIAERAARLRVEIRPDNQPGPGDIPESLQLYSELNERFAEMCPEPARSCISAFAAFEKCKSATPGGACGARPACSEACAVTLQDLRKVNASGCVQWDQHGVSLSPDWTAVAKSKNPSNLSVRTFTPGALELQPPPGPDKPASAGCSVSKMLERGSLPNIGVAGMEGLGGAGALGSVFGSPDGKITGGAPRRVNIAAGVAVGMLVKKVSPEYPPVAKAARVQGTVILQATISTTGDITDLAVIDGPPLLRSAALDAVKQWQYRPYLLNGQPVEVLTTINVIFSLGEGSPAPASPAKAQQ